MTNRARSLNVVAQCLWVGSLAATLSLSTPFGAGQALAGGTPQTDEALIAGAGFAAGDVGYLVVDLDSKRELTKHNPDQPFMPASVAKIATFVPALEILGGDHRFTTTVNAKGTIAAGVLTGSLSLRGGGDPFLTGDDLQDMAKQLKAAGIKQVDGKFLYDDTALIRVPEINSMQPEAAGYNCGVSALSVDFNRVRVEWKNGAADRSATAAAISDNLTLPLGGIGVSFAADTLPGPFVRDGSPPDDRWLLSPNLPAKGDAWLPVGNPARMAAEIFRTVAAREGITLPEPTLGATVDGANELVRHESRPLIDISQQVLHSSNNLSAELVGLATSQALSGHELTLAESGSALAGWWRSHLTDADWSGFSLANHSGLSSKSRATPRQVVLMLEEATRLSGGVDFHDLLRLAGWKGVKGSARVKTGTMSYVRGLAGYIDTVGGHRLVFALFFNDASKRAALDAAFDPHVVAIDARSRSWRNRAIKLENELTKGWAERF